MKLNKVSTESPALITQSSAVTVKPGKAVTKVTIDVGAAIAQADKKALQCDLATVGPVVFALHRWDKKDEFGLVILAKDEGYVDLLRKSGRSAVDKKGGSVISAGTERIEATYKGKTLVLDVTAINAPAKEEEPKAVPAPQPYKAAYEQYFKEGRFDFEPGYKSGKLVKQDKKEFETRFPQVENVFKHLRRPGSSVTEQVKQGFIEIFYDSQSKSYGLVQYQKGASEHMVYIWDKNGERVGTYDVDSSGFLEFFKSRAK